MVEKNTNKSDKGTETAKGSLRDNPKLASLTVKKSYDGRYDKLKGSVITPGDKNK